MTTDTAFGATVRPIELNMQKIWKAIDELKPSDKAKITRGDNKLRSVMAERNRPAQEAYKVILDRECGPRDAKIKEAQEKYDAIVKAAREEFDAVRIQAINEANVFLTPANEANNAVWKTNYELYKQEWYRLVVSVVGEAALR